MNGFQRFAVRLAAKIAPPLGRLLQTSGGTVDRLAETVQLYRDREAEQRDDRQSIVAELREAIALTSSGPWLHGVKEGAAAGNAAVVLKERLAELELALEDRGWKRQLAISETEFSRYGIQQIILISRLYFIKNPLIRRWRQSLCYVRLRAWR